MLTATTALSLTDWQSFYVIIGSSGAALTGLTFIVITITSDANAIVDPVNRLHAMRAFISPTVVHFASTLWLSALMSVPGHSAGSLSVGLGLSGAIGVGYCVRVSRAMRATSASSAYQPFASDWVWNVVIPLLAYIGLIGAALVLRTRSAAALDVVAGLTLLLLFVGLRNAWDVVVWTTTERHARKAQGNPVQQHQQDPPTATDQSPADR
jgi:hypothetical protein